MGDDAGGVKATARVRYTPRMRTSFVVVFLCCVASLTACRSITPPSVEVLAARVTGQGENATVVSFEVLASNPNRVQVPMEKVRYEVWIDGRSAFRAVRSPQATLPGFGEQMFVLPASIPGVVAAGSTFRITGEAAYRAPGAIRETLHDAGMDHPTQGFDGSGTVEGLGS